MRYLLLLFFSFGLSGCVAVAAGAAGASLVESDNEAVGRYIDTHDVEPHIAQAMYDGKIVEGMTKEQVSLLLDQAGYACEKEQEETQETWSCEDQDPMKLRYRIIEFEEGRVVHSEIS